MEIIKGQWFRLPRLGPEAFRSLMQARLKYETARGFLVDDRTDINRVTAILSSALGKPVKIHVPVERPRCYVCDAEVECDTCTYNKVSAKAGACLCNTHYQEPGAYNHYRAVFTQELMKELGANDTHPPIEASGANAWSEKYRPSDLAMMVGGEKQRLTLVEWLSKWKPGAKPALLVGPPGVGKTTLVNLAADRLGLTLVQLNASDNRSKSKLERIIRLDGPSASLLGSWETAKAAPRLFTFMDEVDGLEGREDYGAVEYIKEFVEQSRGPVVMAANDEDSQILTKLMGWNLKDALIIKLPRALPRMVELYVRFVAEREGVDLDRDTLTRLVVNANGDIRAALNNLQQVAKARVEDVPRLLPVRDEQANRAEVFNRIYHATTFKEAYEALDMLEVTRPREILRLALVNIVANPLPREELARAMDSLSRLDRLVFLMEAKQQWHMLRYFRRILAGTLFRYMRDGWRYGEDDPQFQPMRFRVWNDGRVIREIAWKLAEHCHTSSGTAASSIYPYLVVQYASDPTSETLKALIAFDESSQRVTGKEAERITMNLPT